MHSHHPVLVSLCVSLLSLSAACTDSLRPGTSPSDGELPTAVQVVTLNPSQATLPAGEHLAMTANPLNQNGERVTAEITWSTSDPKVATVSGSGDVVAVAPGQAVIMASTAGAYAAAPFTVVPPAPPESVTVSPRQADVEVGKSIQFVVMRGGEVVNTGVVWVSSNPKLASVSSSGLVTGVSAGIASIAASYDGQSASAAVTVLVPTSGTPPVDTTTPPDTVTSPVDTTAPPVVVEPPTDPSDPPGSHVWLHQASGLSMITDNEMNTLPVDDGSVWIDGWRRFDLNNHLSLVSDPSAPWSPQDVLQYRYPQGFQGGSGPGHIAYGSEAKPMKVNGKPVKELFIGFHYKVSNPWQQTRTGQTKIFYTFQAQNGNRNDIVPLLTGQNAPFSMKFVSTYWVGPDNQNSVKSYYPNVSGVTIQPGRWYTIEIYLKAASGYGTSDGVIRCWVDGKLAFDYTNVPRVNVPFSELHMNPVWNGPSSEQKRQTDYIWYDDVYLSGR